MSGVGKTTAARTFARRHDLRLYCLDAYQHAHAACMPAETRSLDEIWVDLTPEELADWFEDRSRERFRLALADLLALDDAAPVIVDGPQLLPELVAEVASSPQAALYIVAQPEVQRRLVHERGRGVAERTRDPERAFANRLGRDEELVRRLRAAAAGHGFPVVEVVDVRETLPQVEHRFLPLLAGWLEAQHGDVSGRRRDENDARLRQWRAVVEDSGSAPSGGLELACECERPGCELTVPVGLVEAESMRARSQRLLATKHS
ncbi:MAG TPA: hypothetical protein VLW49_06850 [Gaiellaceae bacterium]|nr:hypothetical protein [Gaiellaceae bacterium]